MKFPTLRRWRALRPRSRAAVVLLAIAAFLVGVGLLDRWRGDTWPARVVLRNPLVASPLGFSPDGRTILTTGRDGITPWDVASGRKGEAWGVPRGDSPVLGAFSPDGKTYAAAVYHLTHAISIDLFDPATGRTRATLTTPRRTIMHLGFADDGRTLRAFLGDDPQQPGCSGWNPSFGADLNEVVTWDAATGREMSSRPLSPPTRGAITAISPEGRLLAIADPRANAVQLWDLDADRALGILTNPAVPVPVPVAGAGVSFSDDGQTLAIGRVDGTVELWDVPARRLRTTLRGHTDDFLFTTIRFSPEGRTLALTGYRWGPKPPLTRIQDAIRGVLRLRPIYDAELLVLDAATGRGLGRAASSTRPFYSPDGKTLATDEPDGSTRLRDIPAP